MPFVLLLLVLTVPVGGRGLELNPNELSRILLAESLALDSTVVVDGPIEAWGSSQDLAIRGGRHYSDKAPGLSFAGALLARGFDPVLPREPGSRYAAYDPLRHLLTWWLCALPAAAIPFGIFWRWRLGEEGSCMWMALLLALCTPLLTYGTLLFSHVASGGLVVGALALIPRPGTGPGKRVTLPLTALSGLLAGVAVVTEYSTAIVAVVLMALAIRRGGLLAGLAFGCGFLAGVAPALVYHHIAFGSAWTTGYAFKTDPAHAALHARGFFGVSAPSWTPFAGTLFSLRRGLLVYSPILILVPLGVWRMIRRRDPDGAPIALALGAWLLFGAGFSDWEGGWCAAARHLVPAIPLAFVPLARAVTDLNASPWGGGFVRILAGASIAGSVLSLAVTPFFPEIFDAPLAQVALASLKDGVVMPSSLADWTPIARLPAALIWMGVTLGIGFLAVARMTRSGARLPARLGAVGALAAGAILACGLHAAFSPAPTPDQTRARAIVLDRLGYPALARRIESEAGAMPRR